MKEQCCPRALLLVSTCKGTALSGGGGSKWSGGLCVRAEGRTQRWLLGLGPSNQLNIVTFRMTGKTG